jgi:hypothetical protein
MCDIFRRERDADEFDVIVVGHFSISWFLLILDLVFVDWFEE